MNRPVRVTLHAGEEVISNRLPLIRDAVKNFQRDLARTEATWEPHDWQDFP